MKRSGLKRFRIILLAIFLILGISGILPGQTANQTLSRDYMLSSIQSLHTQNLSTESLPANTQQSGNWAGYIAEPTSADGYSQIFGSWTVPTITANQTNALAAQWIGLGGVSSNDLLQIGTIESLRNGQPTVELFWEKLPDAAQNLDVTVPIGSSISAGIKREDGTANVWDLTYSVKTPEGTTQSNTLTVTLDDNYDTAIRTSAEWISEDPSHMNNQLYPLADMGTVTYTSTRVNDQSLTASGNKVIPVAMVARNGNIMIAPSAVGSDGESFSTTVLSTSTLTSPTSTSPSPSSTSPSKTHVRPAVKPQRGWRQHQWSYEFSQTGWSWSWTWTWGR